MPYLELPKNLFIFQETHSTFWIGDQEPNIVLTVQYLFLQAVLTIWKKWEEGILRAQFDLNPQMVMQWCWRRLHCICGGFLATGGLLGESPRSCDGSTQTRASNITGTSPHRSVHVDQAWKGFGYGACLCHQSCTPCGPQYSHPTIFYCLILVLFCFYKNEKCCKWCYVFLIHFLPPLAMSWVKIMRMS